MIEQFFKVLFVIGVAPVDPKTRTLGAVVLVLVIVRFRVVPPAVLAPSIMVFGLSTLMIGPLAVDPLIVVLIPTPVLIVNLFTVLEPGLALIVMGNVSDAE